MESLLSPNTVHFTIRMYLGKSTRLVQLGLRGRNGKLLIFRLTPRGIRRPRLDTTRSSRISASTASWNAFLCRGGDSHELR